MPMHQRCRETALLVYATRVSWEMDRNTCPCVKSVLGKHESVFKNQINASMDVTPINMTVPHTVSEPPLSL